MYLKLYACCIPVKGTIRSLICDLQRGAIYFIPNALFEILNSYKNTSISVIKKNVDNTEILEDYFQFLINNELAFYTDEPRSFPDMSMSFNVSSTVTNAIIDINEASNHNISKIFKELEFLGINAIQIRFFTSPNYNTLKKILKETTNSRFRTIELVLPYQKELDIENIINHNPRLSFIIQYNAKENSLQMHKNECALISTTQAINLIHACGAISPDYFSINTHSFTEALKYNSCLNRKISVDVNGEIKNCPSMKESFGNIKATTLVEALNKEGFKKYWNITKDKIKICQDC